MTRKRTPHWREVEADLQEITALINGADTSIARDGHRRRIRYDPLLKELQDAYGAAYGLRSGPGVKVRSSTGDPTGRAVEDYRDENGNRRTDREQIRQAIRTASGQVVTALNSLRAAHEALRLNVGRGSFLNPPDPAVLPITKGERLESFAMKKKRRAQSTDWHES